MTWHTGYGVMQARDIQVRVCGRQQYENECRARVAQAEARLQQHLSQMLTLPKGACVCDLG